MVSGNEAILVLNNVVVAPVTRTIRSIPICVPVGPDEGVDHDSVATFDPQPLRSQLDLLGSSGSRQLLNQMPRYGQAERQGLVHTGVGRLGRPRGGAGHLYGCDLDAATWPGGPGQPVVDGEQGAIEGFSERHVEGVPAAYVMS